MIADLSSWIPGVPGVFSVVGGDICLEIAGYAVARRQQLKRGFFGLA